MVQGLSLMWPWSIMFLARITGFVFDRAYFGYSSCFWMGSMRMLKTLCIGCMMDVFFFLFFLLETDFVMV